MMHPAQIAAMAMADTSTARAARIDAMPKAPPPDFTASCTVARSERYPDFWQARHGEIVGLGFSQESAIESFFEKWWMSK